MPILWRYLLKHYFSTFFLIAGSFVAILFVSRLKDIAEFASLGGDLSVTILFLSLQIPHILPFAIPVAAFFSAFLLFQKMSQTNELTAFRATGIPLKSIIQPILVASLFISLINIEICSEITTKAKHKMRKLYTEKTSENPLYLLKRQNVTSLKNLFLSMKEQDEKIQDFLMVGKNPYHKTLFLIGAKELSFQNSILEGKGLSSIFFLPKELSFDTLYLENDKKIKSIAPAISSQMKQNKYRLNPSSLPLSLLLLKAKKTEVIFLEILRRFSLGLSPFTLSLLGVAYGIEISRQKKEKLLKAFAFCAFLLACYLAGKHLKGTVWLASSLFIFPHLLIYYVSGKNYLSLTRGRR